MFNMPKYEKNDDSRLNLVRAMHSLREHEVAEIADWLPSFWSIQSHEDYEGDLTIMLVPENAGFPTLIIGKTSTGFQLSSLAADDVHTNAASFPALENLMVAAAALMQKTR